jgi:hypothetical protein
VVLDGGFTVGLLEVFRGRVLGHPEDLVVLRVVALLRRAPEHLGETKRNLSCSIRRGARSRAVCEEIEDTARRLYSYSGAGNGDGEERSGSCGRRGGPGTSRRIWIGRQMAELPEPSGVFLREARVDATLMWVFGFGAGESETSVKERFLCLVVSLLSINVYSFLVQNRLNNDKYLKMKGVYFIGSFTTGSHVHHTIRYSDDFFVIMPIVNSTQVMNYKFTTNSNYLNF